MQKKPGVMFFTFAGMTLLRSDSTLYNFITSWEQIKTLENVAKIVKIKTGVNIWLQVPFKSKNYSRISTMIEVPMESICGNIFGKASKSWNLFKFIAIKLYEEYSNLHTTNFLLV